MLFQKKNCTVDGTTLPAAYTFSKVGGANFINIFNNLIRSWCFIFFFFFFFQASDRFRAAGRDVANDSRAPTNWHDTHARTPARRTSRARCATRSSCAATIWGEARQSYRQLFLSLTTFCVLHHGLPLSIAQMC